MSVATASNITPAIASNVNNGIITSDGDGTLTAEANFTFNGTSAILSGSLTITGSSALIGNSTITGGVTATGGFTGSLIGTATSASNALTASNITPAIASDGINRVLTSDGDGTVTAEANLVFDGSSLSVTGSLTVSGSSTLTNIGPARFRSNMAKSPTVTALEITGGLQVSGSIDSVNRYLYIAGINVPVVKWDSTDLKLIDANTNTSVMWGARYLFDENGLTSIDWNGASSYAPRTLLDTSEVASVRWGNRTLTDSSAITSINWGNRSALYSSGLLAYEWGTPGKINASGSVTITGSLLVSGSGTLRNIGPARFRSNVANSAATLALEVTGGFQVSGSIDSVNRYLYTTNGTTAVVSWGAGGLRLVGSEGNVSTNWGTRYLVDAAGNSAATWDSRVLYDSSELNSVDWESRRLYNAAGYGTVDWEGGALYDSNERVSVNWEERQLGYSNGNRFLDYGTSGRALMNVSGSFIVSASGATNATASLSIEPLVGADNWYNIALRTQKQGVSSSIDISKYITVSHGAGGSIEMMGDTNFYTIQTVRIWNTSGNATVQLDPPVGLTSTLNVTGATRLASTLNVASNTTITGSLTVSGSTASVVILTKVSQSLNFADDTAAAAAGVPLGGLYRNGSFIMIRVS